VSRIRFEIAVLSQGEKKMDIVKLIKERGRVDIEEKEGKLLIMRSLIISGTGKVILRETYVAKNGEVVLDCVEMGESKEKLVEDVSWEKMEIGLGMEC
jgi:hypothetical protein